MLPEPIASRTYPTNERPLRVVYFGMRCTFSIPPLLALLQAGMDVCAVVVHADRAEQGASHPSFQQRVAPAHPPSLLPIIHFAGSEDLVQIAFEHHIPVFEASHINTSRAREALSHLHPDLACVACFPQRIPATLLALLSLGFLNVHPSLLPAHRGPAPLFWTLRDGDPTAGVTIHRMDAGFDTGEIVAQQPITFPDGCDGAEADRLCAMLGAQLLVEAAQGVWRGEILSRSQPSGGSYESWPSPDDFAISTAWSAQRAFNFMRGTAEWGIPYAVDIAGERFLLITALGYKPDEQSDAPYTRSKDQIRIQCTPGVLWASVRARV